MTTETTTQLAIANNVLALAQKLNTQRQRELAAMNDAKDRTANAYARQMDVMKRRVEGRQ